MSTPDGSRPIVVGVAGGSGSGKSTVVRALVAHLGGEATCVITHDAYYRDLACLTMEERAQVNFDHPEALETDLLVHHVEALLRGDPADVPRYDFSTHTRCANSVRVEPTPVVILDGILVLAEERLRRLMDLKVFVDTAADLRLLRRLRRDVAKRGRTALSVIGQYETSVRPMHLEFVEPSKRHADMVIPEGGYNRVAVDLLATRIRRILDQRSASVLP